MVVFNSNTISLGSNFVISLSLKFVITQLCIYEYLGWKFDMVLISLINTSNENSKTNSSTNISASTIYPNYVLQKGCFYDF